MRQGERKHDRTVVGYQLGHGVRVYIIPGDFSYESYVRSS